MKRFGSPPVLPVAASSCSFKKPLSTLCQKIALSSAKEAKEWVAAKKLQESQIRGISRKINKEPPVRSTFATLTAKTNPAAPIPTPVLAIDHTQTIFDSVAPESDFVDVDIDDAQDSVPASNAAPSNIASANANATSYSTVPGTITDNAFAFVSATASAPDLALGTSAQSLVSYVFETTPQVFEMRLASQPEDFHWMEVSSVYEHSEGKVIMDSSFLKTLNVNPKTFFEKDACTTYEWSHVVLLARYYGDDIQGDTNKSIWHSVNNDTPFAIVWPSVRGRIEKCIDALQLRATKSIPIEGYGRRNGIVPVQNAKVKFSVIKHATMETLLNMPDKVRFLSLNP